MCNSLARTGLALTGQAPGGKKKAIRTRFRSIVFVGSASTLQIEKFECDALEQATDHQEVW